MRALNKGWIGIILVILFGLSLFFFNNSSRYSNLFNSDNYVADVSGTKISTSVFLRSLELNIGQFAQMIGEELTGDQIRAFQIHQIVLQNLISNAIFENEFEDKKFIINDEFVASETKRRFPNLYIENKINDDALNSFLNQQRLKIEDLVNIIKFETRSNIFDDLFFKTNYPNKITSKIRMFDNQTRKINLISIPYDNVYLEDTNLEDLSKDNKELLEYYDRNIQKYLSVEKRDISYFIINKQNYKNDFIPSELEISTYYTNNKNIFVSPEQRSFRQFNFKSKEEAENFKLKISNVSNLEDYANENNIIFNKFEELEQNQVLEDLSEVIFSMNVNDISDVITTTLAHHVIVLDKVNPEKEQSLNEVTESIKQSLTNVQLNNFFSDLKIKINQEIINGKSIDAIAADNKLIIKKLQNVEQNNENNDELILTIINDAFKQNKDFISDINDFDNDLSFVTNVDQIYPSKVQDIENIYNDVSKDFIKQKKIEFAQEIFENNNKNDNKNLDIFKSSFNSKIEEIELDLNSEIISPSIKNSLFNAEPGSIKFSFDDTNIYFGQVIEIIIPDDNALFQEIDLISELKNAFGSEIVKTKNISLNDELINGLLSQYK